VFESNKEKLSVCFDRGIVSADIMAVKILLEGGSSSCKEMSKTAGQGTNNLMMNMKMKAMSMNKMVVSIKRNKTSIEMVNKEHK